MLEVKSFLPCVLKNDETKYIYAQTQHVYFYLTRSHENMEIQPCDINYM